MHENLLYRALDLQNPLLSRGPMEPLPTIRAYYCSLDHLYQFGVKGDSALVIKVKDCSRTCLAKMTVTKKDLGELHVREWFQKQTPEALAERFNLLLSNYPPKAPKMTAEGCLQALSRAIEQFKPKVLASSKDLESLTCPISGDVFQDPVIDPHGHTFEKKGIEAWLSKNTTCPVSCEPLALTQLSPNRAVKELIETYRNKDPIPSFSLFKKESAKLAQSSLDAAKICLEEGEYDEALDNFSKAFQYTQDWRCYTQIPTIYQKQGESAKAHLATLYLASYQLKAGALKETIQTLEPCRERPSTLLLPLFTLYELNGESTKALNLVESQIGSPFEREHPTVAIALYKAAIALHPEAFSLYLPLSHLLPRQEQSHFLLKGICHALSRSNLTFARELYEQLPPTCPERRFALELLLPQAPELSTLLEKIGVTATPREALKIYTLLYCKYPKLPYLEKIVFLAKNLSRSSLSLWYQTWISHLLEEKDWPKADAVALEALSCVQDPLPVYQAQERIYTYWSPEKLEPLLLRLAKSYEAKNDLSAFEATLRKANTQFQNFEATLSLIALLKRKEKLQEGVDLCYTGLQAALLQGNLIHHKMYYTQLIDLDPKLTHLSEEKRMHVLTQKTLLDLANRVAELEKQLAPSPLASSSPASKPTAVPVIPLMAFGASQWSTHFGDVGTVPSLPSNINEILNAPCPFWARKKVSETHLLTLIPTHVNGKPFCLDYLKELIQHPKQGPAEDYSYYGDIKPEDKTRVPDKAYWVLLTRNVLHDTRDKTFQEQKQEVDSVGSGYELPGLLEVATSILMEHVRSGKKLYSDDPRTHTRCQEIGNSGHHCIVGDFSASGGAVSGHYDDLRTEASGAGARRKFW